MPNAIHPAIAAGNVAVVTGGASGIGLATAEKLARAGLRGCIADFDEEALAAARETLANVGEVVALRDRRLRRELRRRAGQGGGGAARPRLGADEQRRGRGRRGRDLEPGRAGRRSSG